MTEAYLGIDPGLRMTGWGLWIGDEPFLGLVMPTIPPSADIGRRAMHTAMTIETDGPERYIPRLRGAPIKLRIGCEVMQVRSQERSKDDPNTLVQIQIMASTVAGYLSAKYSHGIPVRYCTPSEWKGSVPKSIHHARFESGLTDAQRVKIRRDLLHIRPPSLRHNAIDALALASKIRAWNTL